MIKNRLAASRCALLCALATVTLVMAIHPASSQPLQPRAPGEKKSLQQMQAQPPVRRVIVKFREGMVVRFNGGQLSGLSSAQAADFASVLSAAGVQSDAISRLHSRSEAELDQERARAQQMSGRQLADLNLYYIVELPVGASAADVASRLNALDAIEFAEPAPVPAPLPVDIAPATPDFTGNQGYKAAAPGGIGVPDPAVMPGTDGAGMQVADVEYSWQMDHEDLELPGSRVLVPAGQTPVDPFNDTNHGTAVMGEIVGLRNAYGVTGIAPAAVGFVAPANFASGFNPAAAISRATAALTAGDVLVIEQQAAACGGACGGDQVGCGPLEVQQASFDAISTATALNIIVVAAAGNGNVNLDAPACGTTFNRAVRDSGAIIVGAGTSTDHSRLNFSSYGSRVDVQGWGHNVTTTGYGDLFDPPDIRQRYTTTFGGTSGATPIVSGAVLAVQGRLKACGMATATPLAMRQALAANGTPQGGANPGANNIGPLPRIPETIAAFNATTCPTGGGGPAGPLACSSATQLGDFNADNRRDLVFRRNDGLTSIYFMNGTSVASAGVVGQIGTEFTLVGIGDFNGDGRADLLMRRTDGTMAIFLMNGSSVIAAQLIGNIGNEWRIVGVGDFNGDGRADFLTRRPDGMLAVYLMNGFQFVGAQIIGQIGTEWTVAQVADFDGNGRADFLTRRADGTLAIYLMAPSGLSVASGTIIGQIGTEWRLIAAGDFNGDARADFLTRRNDGTLAIYLANGSQITGAQIIGNIGTEWKFVGIGDLNADARSDLVFRRGDGTLSAYLISGFQILSGQIAGNVGTEWDSCYGQGLGGLARVVGLN